MRKALKLGLEIEEEPTPATWYVPEGGFAWDDTLRPDQDRVFAPPLPGSPDVPADYAMWLCPVSNVERRYPVLRSRKVLQDFVALGREVSRNTVKAFANTWGWLGLRRPVLAPAGDGTHTLTWAEPLEAWRREASVFTVLWDTWKLVQKATQGSEGSDPKIQRNARAKLAEQVRWLPNDRINFIWPSPVVRWDTIAIPGRREPDNFLLGRWNPGDVVEPARYYVHREVNRRLQGHVNMVVLPFLESRVRFTPDTLLTALYMHFAFGLAGIVDQQERRCANPRCPNGGVFFPRRRDQLTCEKRCREMAAYYRRKGAKHGDT